MDFSTFTKTLGISLNRSGFKVLSDSPESTAWVRRDGGETPIYCNAFPSGTWGDTPAAFVKWGHTGTRKFLKPAECLDFILGLSGGVMKSAAAPVLESALSFSEKRTLQKQLSDAMKSLDSGVDFKTKRTLQKQVQDIIAQLTGGEVQPDEKKSDGAGDTGNAVLADLIAGKYNTLDPNEFLAVVQGVVESLNDVKPVIPPCIGYIEANKDKVNAVLESALRETFGRLWNA